MEIRYTRSKAAGSESKKGKKFWLLPLLSSAVCYALILLAKPVCRLLFSFGDEPVSAQLRAEFYGNSASIIFLLLPPVICLLLYIIASIIGPIREKRELLRVSDLLAAEERRKTYLMQYERYIEHKSTGWKIRVFFYVLLAIEITFVVQCLFFSSAPRETISLYSDLSLLRTGKPLIYKGKFLPTDRPLDNTNDYVIVPDKEYYYFSSDVGTLRCVKSNLQSDTLMQTEYCVEYLPGTHTVVSVTNAAGTTLTGPSGLSSASLPDGSWLYGDLIVRRCTEIYGYDLLTTDEQKAFDLLYGEYYSVAVARGEESTHSFYLPEPLTAEGYQRVLSLYGAVTYYQKNRQPWRYATDDAGPVRNVYAGRIISDTNPQYFEAWDAAAELVSGMPPDLTDREKCYYLAQYLVEHVTPYNGEMPQTEFQDSNGVTIRVAVPDPEWATAYGALVEGRANYEGLSAAFALLSREAGVDCICIVGETVDGAHVWNMVRIDGNWYHVDTVWMNKGGVVDETYFLADDGQMEITHRPASYGGCAFVPVPASGPQERSR
ncbi:transglutaminase domain-containing protein [Lacrimispora sphenoides]|uniref:Transglutaminase-like superfamily protein n=1 Tax=Lacrimispora sphenoides JCM 1415 TaxID=1297793 RepID=A0ABY1C8A7_9FIRM|nr:transglutaminase domain-containing protein [Lacrimispora sphenoides]SET79549.1 Transglutaminase-like superfamily protein [[Clostridium] sphenoides JCM 1415]SUY51325.1 transglutaminase/protease [Lacrimispora sphenoides]